MCVSGLEGETWGWRVWCVGVACINKRSYFIVK